MLIRNPMMPPIRTSPAPRAGWIVVWGVLLLSAGCRNHPGPESQQRALSPGTVIRTHATVRRFPIDAETFVLVDSIGTRYVPDDLPGPFRSEGIEVFLTARVLTPPPNVRLAGPPITLLRIVRIGGSAS